MVNEYDVLKQILVTTGTSLYTLTGTRVYFGRLPQGYANSQAALLLNRVGGAPDGYVADYESVFRVKCYGGTADHGVANSVYLALSDRLHFNEPEAVAAGMLCCATLEIAGQELFEPDTAWPILLCQYRTLIRGL